MLMGRGFVGYDALDQRGNKGNMDSHQAVVKVLRKHFAERQSKNPNYSLRAFAKHLQLSPAALSEVLSGKRSVTIKFAQKISQKLFLGPSEQKELLASFELNKGSARKPKGFIALEAEQFRVISDWHYFAILSLSETRDFNDSPDDIAARLNISSAKARAALETLERLSLLKKENGKLVPTGMQFETSDDVLSIGIQKNHSQGLELAGQSLSSHKVNERDFTSLTLAVDPSKLPKAKKMIRSFRQKLAEALECGEQTEVYRLQVQFFPLSRRS